MTINWYPGHMHKTRKGINKTIQSMDLLIEIVDARIPYSSRNPLVTQWRQSIPSVLIVNKTDLAENNSTQLWLDFFKSDYDHLLLGSKDDRKLTKSLLQLCQQYQRTSNTDITPVNAIITGIPNVGKSTLINSLCGKAIAKVGNEPAVTKLQQKFYVSKKLTLHDTPGLLWPKIDNQDSGYRLAVCGSIKNTAIDIEDIGLYAAEVLLKQHYPSLQQRYQFDQIPKDATHCLEAIGRKRGAVRKGGLVDLHKSADVLLTDFRAGQLGAITLETPQMIDEELSRNTV